MLYPYYKTNLGDFKMIVTQNHGFISVARIPKGTVINGKSVGGNFVEMKHIGIFNAKPIVSELIAKEKAVLFENA